MSNKTHNPGEIAVTKSKVIGRLGAISGPSYEMYITYARIYINDNQFYKVNALSVQSFDKLLNECAYAYLANDPKYANKIDDEHDEYDVVPKNAAIKTAKEMLKELLYTQFADIDGLKFINDENYRDETFAEIASKNKKLVDLYNNPGWMYSPLNRVSYGD